jgi:hypothetical protein
MNLDPRIGTLNSGKCYAYVNGYAAEPVVGSLEEVELALGLRKPVAAAKPARTVRTFVVTVTPGVTSWNVQEYEVRVNARDRNEAMRRARAEYNDSVGIINNGACTVRARLAAE